uniref:Iwr1 domain-containing protein n=1 Tax=Rhabditophanes sp. KR3021 TaxID=114890 RepID=A0AC35TPY4_9BILA
MSTIPIIRVTRKRNYPVMQGLVLTVKRSKDNNGKAVLGNVPYPDEVILSTDTYFELLKSTDIGNAQEAGLMECGKDVVMKVIDFDGEKGSELENGPCLYDPNSSKFLSMMENLARKNQPHEDNDVVMYDYYKVKNVESVGIDHPVLTDQEYALREATCDEVKLWFPTNSDDSDGEKENGLYEDEDSNSESNWRNDYPDSSGGSTSSYDDNSGLYDDDNAANFNEYDDEEEF